MENCQIIEKENGRFGVGDEEFVSMADANAYADMHSKVQKIMTMSAPLDKKRMKFIQLCKKTIKFDGNVEQNAIDTAVTHKRCPTICDLWRHVVDFDNRALIDGYFDLFDKGDSGHWVYPRAKTDVAKSANFE